MKKKKRKLSEEAKEKLSARLVKARASRKPAKHKNVHPSVLAKPDDHPYSLVTVKEWINHNKEYIKNLEKSVRARDIPEKTKMPLRTEAGNRKGYVHQMEHYLRHGDWIASYSGRNEENKVIPRCVAMAYHSDGTPKRTVGIFYSDINRTWTNYDIEADYMPVVEEVVTKPTTTTALTDKQFEAAT